MRGRTLLALSFVVLSAAACGDDGGDDGVDCSESTLTYANFAEDFFQSHCLECHDTANMGADRNDAPDEVNFNTIELVMENATRARARAGVGSSMPPDTASSSPSQAERDDLAEWIDCGLQP